MNWPLGKITKQNFPIAYWAIQLIIAIIGQFVIRNRWLIGISVIVIVVVSFSAITAAQFLSSHELTSELLDIEADEVQASSSHIRVINGIQRFGMVLLGATTIITSIVLTAMQGVFDRIPYNLFKRLSSDGILMILTICAFSLSSGLIVITSIMKLSELYLVGILSLCIIVVYFVVLLCAYSRAIQIINPEYQLFIQETLVNNSMIIWFKRMQRVMVELDNDNFTNATTGNRKLLEKLIEISNSQFQEWTFKVDKAIQNAMTYARRYSDKGEYDISSEALKTIVKLNSGYIFAHLPDNNGMSTYLSNIEVNDDPIILGTLEKLRLHTKLGINKQDETQVLQSILSMNDLAIAYQKVQYSNNMRHAMLAADYLIREINTVCTLNMDNVYQRGQKMLGLTSKNLIHSNSNDIDQCLSSICVFANNRRTTRNIKPLVEEGMRQFSNTTIELLSARLEDIEPPLEVISNGISAITFRYLHEQEEKDRNTDTSALDLFYSTKDTSSLCVRIKKIVDKLSQNSRTDDFVNRFICNLEKWASKNIANHQKLLNYSISNRLRFTNVLLRWNVHITEIFLAASAIETDCMTTKSAQERMNSHAMSLFRIMSSIAMREGIVKFVESCDYFDVLFCSAIATHTYGPSLISAHVSRTILNWSTNGARYITDSMFVERGVCACAIIALRNDEGSSDKAFRSITSAIRTNTRLSASDLRQIEINLRNEANPEQQQILLQPVFREAMNGIDNEKLKSLLQRISEFVFLCAIDAS